MAEHIAGMRAEETMVNGVSTARSRVRMPRIGGYGLVAAALIALLVAGMALHDRHAPHASVSVAPNVVTRAETRLIENNTTNLPNAVAPEIQPSVVTREQQRFLEVNTTMFPNAVAADAVSPVMTMSQRRFLEVNTMLPTGGLYPYAEDMTPLPGHPR
ncbi:MAG: hypothetical protein ACR2M3_16655 [Thermomicrobiales bacterium]